jgi:chloride channel 3/4/5
VNISDVTEVRRYEDFSTIDWVDVAARENMLRCLTIEKFRPASRVAAGSSDTRGRIRHKLYEVYTAAQSWLVLALIGMAIGAIAAVLNISTEWLADLKTGYCSTGFYLNEDFCCWGTEGDHCPAWQSWTGFGLLNYFVYVGFAAGFAALAAFLVKTYAPYAAGSGISEIKCIVAGFVMQGFLGPWTLLLKSIGLPLAIASGLSVGKEGPSVHYAVCAGHVIASLFGRYRNSKSKMREIYSACTAAGVAVAFGSPIGGVLFSLEEITSNFQMKTMWRSYFCALVATGVLAAFNPFRTGQLVMFQVKYDRDWHFFEIFFFSIIGVFGGMYGIFVSKWNLRVQSFRKRYLGKYAVKEATLLASLTALICYSNEFLRLDMTAAMENLFHECENGWEKYHDLCQPDRQGLTMLLSLLAACVIRTFLVIISYGCKVPAGIFVPSMAVGATFGRLIGNIVQYWQQARPDSIIFSQCVVDQPCITPGAYAFLGAAAALSGITNIFVTVVVIMFELTGALTYILPTMIVVGITKAISDRFGKGGIADQMIWFNGFPFIDNKEEHAFNAPVSKAMQKNAVYFTYDSITLKEVETLLESNPFQGYPVVESSKEDPPMLVGYIAKEEIVRLIAKFKALNRDIHSSELGQVQCYFGEIPESARQSSQAFIDMRPSINTCPLTVAPLAPLENVTSIFLQMGPKVVLVVKEGRLVGLISRKDVLKYQFITERQHNHHTRLQTQQYNEQLEERVWKLLNQAGDYINHGLAKIKGYVLRR